jgi:hypothetical protein
MGLHKHTDSDARGSVPGHRHDEGAIDEGRTLLARVGATLSTSVLMARGARASFRGARANYSSLPVALTISSQLGTPRLVVTVTMDR